MIRARPQATFFGPVGCSCCRGTGYKGRIAIHEVMVMDDGTREAVAAAADPAAIRAAAIRAGMRPLLLDGLEKAACGITAIEDVVRVAPRG
jgi:type II secretory ATPase GspE/PulE/Tfp pilus assembly ATPase PilB-like protein